MRREVGGLENKGRYDPFSRLSGQANPNRHSGLGAFERASSSHFRVISSYGEAVHGN
jgi:hypothetical protein